MAEMRDPGCESNARESQTEAIGLVEWGRSPRFAEVNGAKVIAAVDLPESVLHALATLVDAISHEFGEAEARRLAAKAEQPRRMCRWHLGQLDGYCGPCRSEQIAATTQESR